MYTSVVTDTLLGIRYELTERKESGGYELLRTSENGLLYLQKNKQALPLMITGCILLTGRLSILHSLLKKSG